MPLKQTSFNFDFEPEARHSGEAQNREIKPTTAPEKINATPIEVNFSASSVTPTLTNKKSTRGRMKLKDMASGADLIDIPDDETLFSRRYYSIGAVSEMFKVNHSLIRFWENEFDILNPKKNGKGDRLFRPEDIKNLKLIYHLLRERKYTIEGAKDFLKKSKHADKKFQMIESLKDLKSFLLELKASH